MPCGRGTSDGFGSPGDPLSLGVTNKLLDIGGLPSLTGKYHEIPDGSLHPLNNCGVSFSVVLRKIQGGSVEFYGGECIYKGIFH